MAGREKEGNLLYTMAANQEPKPYTAPLVVNQTARVVGLYYQGGKLLDGTFTFVDGIINEKGGRTSQSMGFQTDVNSTIDLGSPQQISTIVAHTLRAGGTYVYPPKGMQVFGSTNGTYYKPLAATEKYTQNKEKAIMSVAVKPVTVRFIKVVIHNQKVVPEGRPGVGEKTWLFVDEIQVN